MDINTIVQIPQIDHKIKHIIACYYPACSRYGLICFEITLFQVIFKEI